MVTFLLTSALFLGLVALALYFWQKPAKTTDYIELPPPPPASLFTNQATELLNDAPPEPQQQQQQAADDESKAKIELAEQFIESWRESPDRASTAKMLHLAALSDDAETYRNAVEVALRVWQNGNIPNLSATELQRLLTSEFWVLSSSTRNTGAGFVLKRTLSHAKRELHQ